MRLMLRFAEPIPAYPGYAPGPASGRIGGGDQSNRPFADGQHRNEWGTGGLPVQESVKWPVPPWSIWAFRLRSLPF